MRQECRSEGRGEERGGEEGDRHRDKNRREDSERERERERAPIRAFASRWSGETREPWVSDGPLYCIGYVLVLFHRTWVYEGSYVAV